MAKTKMILLLINKQMMGAPMRLYGKKKEFPFLYRGGEPMNSKAQ